MCAAGDPSDDGGVAECGRGADDAGPAYAVLGEGAASGVSDMDELQVASLFQWAGEAVCGDGGDGQHAGAGGGDVVGGCAEAGLDGTGLVHCVQ